MKKLITLFAAVLMAVGASAQETGTPIALGGGWNAGFAGDADVYNFTVVKQWGAAEYACNVLAADYPKCIVELEEALPANFQINYMWKASADAEGDATARYGIAVGDGEKKSFEITFEDGHNYITSVSVQNKDENVEAKLVIKKLTLVAKSGENKIVSPVFTGWAGTDNTQYYKGTVSFNKQYQQLVLKDVTGMKDIQIKVELAEDATNVQMCVDYEDGTSEWPQFTGKVATFSTKEGAVIKNCGIQFTPTEGSASVEVVGAWIISTTGVQKIEVLNPANAEFVNAAGQKVGKNYKGLVINKATGKKYINK